MIKEQLKELIDTTIIALVDVEKIKKEALNFLSKITINPIKQGHDGDYATNAALLLAKPLKTSPIDVAKLIAGSIENSSIIERCEVKGPGFLNIFVSDECLSRIIPAIAKANKNYGLTIREDKKKVLIEFVSANPTGGLHLGHARGAFVGDALSRILNAAGFLVKKEFYVNDVGNQIETLARTIHKRYRELFGETVVIEKGEYPGEYVIDIAKELKKKDNDYWLYKDEAEWLEPLSRFGIDYNMDQIKKTLKRLNISIDNYYFESDLHEEEKLTKLLNDYAERSMLYEAESAQQSNNKKRREKSKAAQFAHLQEGGLFLKTSQFGDDEDRIVKRKDGRFVYLTADLSYHHEKFKRGYDTLINVFGADHAGHIGRIRAGMKALGHDDNKLKFVVVQMVRLLKDNKELRFSKRAGEVFSLDDLVEIVSSDVARFVFLMRTPNAQFDLDLDVVLKNTNENPVFYVQYGHARMATILRKAKENGIKIDATKFSYEEQKILSLPLERNLLLKMSELREVVQEAAYTLEPHKLIYYSQELIKLFHAYFTTYRHTERIISEDELKTKARLKMVFALKTTIKNALSILGINAPDYMEQGE